MAIISDAMKQPVNSEVQPEPEAEGAAEETSDISPSEQAAYDKVVLASMKVLYDDQTHPGIMQMLQSGKDDPSNALADAAATILMMLDKQSGNKIPKSVILPASEEVMSMVAELADKSGAFKVDDETVNLATQKMVAVLVKTYANSDETAAELTKGFREEIEQMKQQQGV